MLPLPTTIAGALTLVDDITAKLYNANDKIKEASKYINASSLIDVTKIARVEPICVIDADIINLEYTTDILQSMQSIFAGYYLQAVALIGNIGDISIAKKLAPLNPNRDTIFESYKPDVRLCSESYKHRLPTSKNALAVSMEATASNKVGNKGVNNVTPHINYGVIDRDKIVSMMDADKDVNKTILEVSNLCIGKLYNVALTDSENSKNVASVKIAIRLMVNSIPTSSMVNLLTFKDQFDMDVKERYHAWRAGRLGFIKDLILCRDIIDKHRSTLIKDKTNIYAKILNRENNNLKAGLFNRNPSLATASNLIVTSTDTIAMIEQKIGAKFSNYKTRQTIFENTNLMIMAVVDKSWERVTWYYRGIQESSQVSIKDMKVSNKSNDGNVLDVMKAFISGGQPNL